MPKLTNGMQKIRALAVARMVDDDIRCSACDQEGGPHCVEETCTKMGEYINKVIDEYKKAGRMNEIDLPYGAKTWRDARRVREMLERRNAWARYQNGQRNREAVEPHKAACSILNDAHAAKAIEGVKRHARGYVESDRRIDTEWLANLIYEKFIKTAGEGGEAAVTKPSSVPKASLEQLTSQIEKMGGVSRTSYRNTVNMDALDAMANKFTIAANESE